MRLPTLLLLAFVLLPGCGNGDERAGPARREGPPVVQCVNYPLAWMTERLAGDAVQVRFDVPRGLDPAFWKPSDAEVAAFQQADLIVRNGAKYARWMTTVSLPTSRVVDTSAAFREQLIAVSGGVTHSHGPGGEHSHGGTAFTTWLDFTQAAAQVDAIADALAKRGWVPAARLEANRSELKEQLTALGREMGAVGQHAGERPLLASHPVYQYLARAYGLNLKSEHYEPDEVPSEEAFGILASMLKNYKATLMLWEAEPQPETRRRLEALGVRSVVFDPCANRPADGDFLSVMRANIERLDAALK